jgi:hypothetical protein
MRALVTAYAVPKIGCPPWEIEDAVSVVHVEDRMNKVSKFDRTMHCDITTTMLKVSVADGATESYRAKAWAAHLTDTLAGSGKTWCEARGFMRRYKKAVRKWKTVVRGYRADRERDGRPIEWYEEPGLERGAYATVIGVQFEENDDRTNQVWRAVAIGDSCVFQVRGDELLFDFPMDAANKFTSSPPLVPSRTGLYDLVRKHVDTTGKKDWQSGDTFYVLTDALAAWFLRLVEGGQKPWQRLRDVDTRELKDFQQWVDDERSMGELRNDDTTLVRVDLEP